MHGLKIVYTGHAGCIQCKVLCMNAYVPSIRMIQCSAQKKRTPDLLDAYELLARKGFNNEECATFCLNRRLAGTLARSACNLSVGEASGFL